MVLDSVHEALDFVEQVKHNPELFDPASLNQSLRDFDAYAKNVLNAKVCIWCDGPSDLQEIEIMLGHVAVQSKHAEARKQVESGTVTIAGSTEKLSPGDIKQARPQP